MTLDPRCFRVPGEGDTEMNAPYHIDHTYERFIDGHCVWDCECLVGFEMVEGDPLITEIWLLGARKVKREDGVTTHLWNHVLADPATFAIMVKDIGDKLDEYMTDSAVDLGATARDDYREIGSDYLALVL